MRSIQIPAAIETAVILLCLGCQQRNESDTTSFSPSPVVTTSQVKQELELIEVFEPLRVIAPGTALKPELFSTFQRKKEGLDEGVITDISTVKGTYSKTVIPCKTALHADFLTEIKPHARILSSSPKGYRTAVIPITQIASGEVSTLVPGHRVKLRRSDNKTLLANGKYLGDGNQDCLRKPPQTEAVFIVTDEEFEAISQWQSLENAQFDINIENE